MAARRPIATSARADRRRAAMQKEGRRACARRPRGVAGDAARRSPPSRFQAIISSRDAIAKYYRSLKIMVS
jgi:hypothetical protein